MAMPLNIATIHKTADAESFLRVCWEAIIQGANGLAVPVCAAPDGAVHVFSEKTDGERNPILLTRLFLLAREVSGLQLFLDLQVSAGQTDLSAHSALCSAIESAGLAACTTVVCYDHPCLRAMAQAYPAVRFGVKCVCRLVSPAAYAQSVRANTLYTSLIYVSDIAQVARECHEEGVRLILWPLQEDPEYIAQAVSAGIDGIVTASPECVAGLLPKDCAAKGGL